MRNKSTLSVNIITDTYKSLIKKEEEAKKKKKFICHAKIFWAFGTHWIAYTLEIHVVYSFLFFFFFAIFFSLLCSFLYYSWDTWMWNKVEWRENDSFYYMLLSIDDSDLSWQYNNNNNKTVRKKKII